MTEIHSPLPPEECLRRIEASFDAPLRRTFLYSPPRREIHGRVAGNRIEAAVLAPRDSSSSNAHFLGRVLPEEEGSLIVGALGVRITRVFWAVWFGFVGLFFLGAATHLSLGLSNAVGVLVMVVMLVAGAYGFRSIRRLQEADRREIVALLTRAGEGRPPAGP